MTNRLAGETSPYLRQHAENPVDWPETETVSESAASFEGGSSLYHMQSGDHATLVE